MRVELVGHLFCDTYSIALHKHQCWEYVYYTRGSGIVYMDGEAIPFEAGDFFIIPPGIVHGEDAKSGFQNYYCSLCSCDLPSSGYIKLQDRDGVLLNAMERMYMEYHLKRNNRSAIVDTHLQLIDQYIYSFWNEPDSNRYVSEAVSTILENISNPKFSVDEMIESFPFQKNYFMRMFQRQIGKTPLRFLIDHRMSYAIQLLEARKISGLSLKEISYMAGYNDYYYFSRAFKKHTGYSPIEWRGTPTKDHATSESEGV